MSVPSPRRRPAAPPRRWAAVLALVILLAGSALAAADVGPGGTARIAQLPGACGLLTQTEAQTLTGIPMLPAEDAGSLCTYNSDPNGPTAQVLISVSSETPRTLEVDRALGHVFTSPAGLGQEAYQEDSNIFVRTGAVWVAIGLVAPNDPPLYEQALRDAAAVAISRVPASAAPAPPVAPAPPDVGGALPPGGGTNRLWRGKQKRFGGNLSALKNVVYQPNVVLIGGGAASIRDVSDDGLTWTVAGGAPGASELKVGKVMAATTLATGRVVALKKAGGNLRVTLGPVTLTQLIRKGTFDADNAPVKQPLYYGAALPAKGPAGKQTTATTAAATAAGGKLTTTPICCTYTGLRLTYDHPAGRLAGSVEIQVPKPTVDFHLEIDGGKLKEATLRLNSAAALDYQIDAATTGVSGNFNSGDQVVPVSISVPLGGAFSLTFTQSFRASMQLGGAASFKTRAEYAIKGGVGFSYRNGRFQAESVSLAKTAGFSENTSSIALAPSAFSLGWSLRATVGVGMAGLTAGAWYQLTPGLALATNSFGTCVTGRLFVQGQYGVGYTMPKFVQNLINFVIGKLGAAPIPSVGGPKSAPHTIFDSGQPQESCTGPVV